MFGWLCPKCARVFGPCVQECTYCNNPGGGVQVSTGLVKKPTQVAPPFVVNWPPVPPYTMEESQPLIKPFGEDVYLSEDRN